MTRLQTELNRLKELRERATAGPFYVKETVEDTPSIFFKNPFRESQDEILCAVYWPAHGDSDLRVVEQQFPDLARFIVESANRWLQLIEALEVAVGELNYISKTNHGVDCDHDSMLLARDTLAKIKQLICGGAE